MNHEFCAKNTDGTRIQFIEEINKNDLITKKCKKICAALNYIEFLVLLFQLIILLAIACPAVKFKNCAITAGIKKYKFIINKKDKEG